MAPSSISLITGLKKKRSMNMRGLKLKCFVPILGVENVTGPHGLGTSKLKQYEIFQIFFSDRQKLNSNN